jgi:hypothetical protein
MNKKMLATSVGQHRRLYPRVIGYRLKHDRFVWKFLDEDWFVTRYADETFSLQRTSGHVLDLPTDSIREYQRNPMGPGFFILKAQVYVAGLNVWIEPILQTSASESPALRAKLNGPRALRSLRRRSGTRYMPDWAYA